MGKKKTKKIIIREIAILIGFISISYIINKIYIDFFGPTIGEDLGIEYYDSDTGTQSSFMLIVFGRLIPLFFVYIIRGIGFFVRKLTKRTEESGV